MIARYSRPKMAQLWSEEAQFRTWMDIEVLACEGWARVGTIPPDAIQQIRERANIDIPKILEREKITRHDVAAFVSVLQENVGEAGRFIHLGITSSDIVDTAFSYRLKKSGELILEELKACRAVTKDRALRDRELLMIGRTHGIHAEPTTMGLKWLLWHDALHRAEKRIQRAVEEISYGKLSGAVGTYANVPPEVEKFVCEKLGLKVDTLSTQVIARDRHAAYFSALGLLGSVVEMIAVELRHLQRTEVSEVREGFRKGQKGSSSMPHKRNPISAENLTGLSRLLRSMVVPALEDCALWHERDISHSSVERVIGPDGNILADYVVSRLTDLLSGLEVFPERMRENLDSLQGVVYSQQLLTALINRGMSRDQAYEIVQRNALKAVDTRTPFLGLLKQEPEVTKVLPERELTMLFNPQSHLQHLDYLYKKVLHEAD